MTTINYRLDENTQKIIKSITIPEHTQEEEIDPASLDEAIESIQDSISRLDNEIISIQELNTKQIADKQKQRTDLVTKLQEAIDNKTNILSLVGNN